LEVFAVVVWGGRRGVCDALSRKEICEDFFVLGSFCIEGMNEGIHFLFGDSGESLGLCVGDCSDWFLVYAVYTRVVLGVRGERFDRVLRCLVSMVSHGFYFGIVCLS